MRKQYIWMAVANDEYRLPIAVADTSSELARILGVKQRSILSYTCRHNTKEIRYLKIEVADDDE